MTSVTNDKKEPSLQRSGIYLYAIGAGLIQSEVIRFKSHSLNTYLLYQLLCPVDSRDWEESSEGNRQKSLSSWSLHSRRLRGKKTNK